MKIRTPYYYKDFKCIAGDCTDTCCAGWDVDVDEESYRYYKSVKGEFGKRLKSVMVPEEEGGCTFTLTEDKRCPFLNDKNLCDLYIALGEEHLCETCDEFPRFINEYGNVREIGIAPSCITAGELMFADRQKMHFDEYEDGKPVDMYNDIDAFLYMQLCNARKLAFDIIDYEEFSVDEVCIILLEFARQIQKHMDDERDDLIASVVKRFKDTDYCRNVVNSCKKKIKTDNDKQREAGRAGAGSRYIDAVSKFFDSFKGMEVINKDWLIYVDKERAFEQDIKKLNKSDKAGGEVLPGMGYAEADEQHRDYAEADEKHRDCECADEKYRDALKGFKNYYKDKEYQFRQLLDYYVYRYFLDSVYDINLMLKIKNAVVGFLIVRQLDMVCWYEKGCTEYDEHVDIAHLYSRQFEHSYTNFEVYSDYYMRKRCYSTKMLEGLLLYED